MLFEGRVYFLTNPNIFSSKKFSQPNLWPEEENGFKEVTMGIINQIVTRMMMMTMMIILMNMTIMK